MENKIWFDLIDFENKYVINKKGEVKSKYTTSEKCGRKPTGNIIKQYVGRAGYYVIPLSIYQKSKTRFVHRLIAINFIPNPENKPQVNHIDGNKLNNSIENLEWCTPSENAKHAYKNKLSVGLSGSKSHFAKLTEHDVLQIRLLSNYIEQTLIIKIFNISAGTASMIINRKTWKHI